MSTSHASPVQPDVPHVRPIVTERIAPSMNGILGVLGLILLGLAGSALVAWGIVRLAHDEPGVTPLVAGLVVILLVGPICQTAVTVVSPGETKVLQFLGKYVGTIRHDGVRLTYPFTSKHKVSVKVRNFETRELKVNDASGNPINIAAIVVWQVADTAQSVFAVEDYEEFVTVQSEAALRHVATIHPYDNGDAGEATLRGSTDQVAAELAAEVGERIALAGLKVIETRISTLAFAPEIAQAMLQRQQAEALLAARSRIVEGAVTMVESALGRIEADGIVNLDDERKAAMVSNLLVVLCSDSRATPVVNTGTLYN
ncbi:MAG: SPFH domain-containing protein [Propionibacteriaceae bacterium]|jgi:regulator of protease activity HflC (stomatin/prohibitin superfamily)|nr:SPFH domain-containing protein [Propionibacteriaceae bacterium]